MYAFPQVGHRLHFLALLVSALLDLFSLQQLFSPAAVQTWSFLNCPSDFPFCGLS